MRANVLNQINLFLRKRKPDLPMPNTVEAPFSIVLNKRNKSLVFKEVPFKCEEEARTRTTQSHVPWRK